MAFAPVFQRPFSATFDRRAAAGGNGLLNNLIAYWKMDEASGNALDAHTNALHLTAANAPGSAAGKIETARTFNGTNQYIELADNALLSTGDVDFTFSAWVYLATVTANMTLLSKYNTSGNQREYLLFYNDGDHAPNNRMSFIISSNGTATSTVDATDFGAISVNTWYHVIAWHDAGNNQIGISVNNTATTAAYSSGVFDSTAAFILGGLNTGGGIYRLSGRLDEIAMWKSAAGGGGVLTADQRTALWNSGAGLPYASFD